MKKLFENVGGNMFKLEQQENAPANADSNTVKSALETKFKDSKGQYDLNWEAWKLLNMDPNKFAEYDNLGHYKNKFINYYKKNPKYFTRDFGIRNLVGKFVDSASK